MLLTDSHTHLYSSQFESDRNEVIQNAINAGVSRLFLPNVDSKSIAGMMELSKQFPENCFPMMGLHPCSVKEDYLQELEIVKSWLTKEKFYAIGEIGIDLYWDKTFLEQQKDAFMQQVELSYHYDLPIVIHCRNSFNEIYECLTKIKTPNLKGIFHCFSGTLGEAQKVIDLGLYLGIGGVVTFKKGGLDIVIKDIPLERIVLETDSPYLAPMPYRGKRNESGYITYVASKIAELKNIRIEEVAKITTQNTIDIFGI